MFIPKLDQKVQKSIFKLTSSHLKLSVRLHSVEALGTREVVSSQQDNHTLWAPLKKQDNHMLLKKCNKHTKR